MKHNKPVALVTGANQGIGYQIAKELVTHGFTVLAGSRDLARGVAAVKTIDGDAHAIQLDVTDQASINAAAEHVRKEYGRLDLLINNAAISNTRYKPGMSLEDYFEISKASVVPLDEVRAIWETNVFGVLALTQAMLPLLREASSARIVNVSSGVGSLTNNSDPSFAYRTMYSPGYAASKTALNGITLAFAIELESTNIKVNLVTPGFTKTALNGFQGTETLEQGAAEAVRVALLGPEEPTGTFTQSVGVTVPW